MNDQNIPVVDAHHHLWVHDADRFLCDELYGDIKTSGYNVQSTVFIECKSMYRRHGPEEFQPVGEMEFANGCGALGESTVLGPTHICAAIVGRADLALGDRVKGVLEKLCEAGGERIRGIRYITSHVPEVKVEASKDLMLDRKFQEGFACLKEFHLRFDSWQYHPQLPQLLTLLRTAPDIPVVINHAGGLIGMGSFAARREEAIADWRRSLTALAALPNVYLKLGAFSMPVFALTPDMPKGEEHLTVFAERVRPLMETCIEIFGVRRCMFESNFPVSRNKYTYKETWDILNMASRGFSLSERQRLFAGTAREFYAI